MGIKSNNKAESYYNYFADSGLDAVTPKPPPVMTATGGDVVWTYNGYKIHRFNSPGTFVVTQLADGEVEFVVMAGGGSGGANWGGGGGAGGIWRSDPTDPGHPVVTLPATGTYPVTIGDGGAAPPPGGSGAGQGNPGGNTTWHTYTAAGGGGGGTQSSSGPLTNGLPGGNGGGASSDWNTGKVSGTAGGASPPGQGNLGGENVWTPTTVAMAGGGGGAGGDGQDGTGAPGSGGNGGLGIQLPGIFSDPAKLSGPVAEKLGTGGGISGDGSFWVCGGGGGNAPGNNGGQGGTEGAGAGGGACVHPNCGVGVDHTAGGGGGGQASPTGAGYAGGKGMLLLAYPVT